MGIGRKSIIVSDMRVFSFPAWLRLLISTLYTFPLPLHLAFIEMVGG